MTVTVVAFVLLIVLGIFVLGAIWIMLSPGNDDGGGWQ